MPRGTRTQDTPLAAHPRCYRRSIAPLLESPRARRRLLLVGALTTVLGIVVAVTLLVPSHGPPSAKPTAHEGPPRLATAPAKLTATDRRAIDATLDTFIPAGMERRNAAAAWALAGPEMKSSSSLAAWHRGASPIPYFLPREKTFHDWQTVDVGRGYVIFNLLLHPVHRSVGSYVFSGQVVKQRGRWLVNRLYTIAIMKPPTHSGLHEVGPADFAAPAGSGQSPPGKPVLGGFGIIPVVSVLALVLLVPLSLGLIALGRARRWRRLVRSSDRTALPPLPSGYLDPTEKPHEPPGTA
jgi:hypothetical protein